MHSTQTTARHRFVLELLHGGRPLPALPLERADFGRAIEATFFDALRIGHFSEYAPPADVIVEPVLTHVSPLAEAFDVAVPLPQGGEQRRRFGADYFANVAMQRGAQLAVAGQVPPDATLAYRLAAYADEPQPRKKRGLTLHLEEEAPAIPIRTRERLTRGPVEVWDATTADDFPVVIPRHVLEESVEEARRAPEREVGGVLLGHLCREEGTNELFLAVTCLVPCEETEATALSVTFTHATLARVREVAEWRGEGELIVGWMHSHPFRLCAECPLPVPAECQAKVLFYSGDDEFVMETSFARPFMVGLLAAVDPKIEATLKRVPVRLFGWDGGRVRQRGFEVSE
jgi:proteasome lid subunit RPN8/RPN11